MKKDIICIIPARRGSKRIKNKNIINFYGKPLIIYSVLNAKKSNIFKKILVSTDSKKIKNICLKYKIDVPFIRNKKLSSDKALIKDVILDAILNIQSQNIKYHCLLYPTAPLIKTEDLKTAYKKLKKNNNADGIVSVSRYSSNPLRSLSIKNKFLKFNYPKYKNINSNNLKKFYYDSGSFFIFKTSSFLKYKNLWMKKIIPYTVKPEQAIDINNYEDLEIAKILFKKK